jgi:hypothetical protein
VAAGRKYHKRVGAPLTFLTIVLRLTVQERTTGRSGQGDPGRLGCVRKRELCTLARWIGLSRIEAGAPADEIEMMPDMIEAGAKAIFDFQDDLMARQLVEKVYQAMERAKKYQQTSPSTELRVD